MADLGKFLLVLAGTLAVVGLLLLFAGKLNLPLGRLPGDITYRGKNTVIYFPLATSLPISIVLSLLLWLINRGRQYAFRATSSWPDGDGSVIFFPRPQGGARGGIYLSSCSSETTSVPSNFLRPLRHA